GHILLRTADRLALVFQRAAAIFQMTLVGKLLEPGLPFGDAFLHLCRGRSGLLAGATVEKKELSHDVSWEVVEIDMHACRDSLTFGSSVWGQISLRPRLNSPSPRKTTSREGSHRRLLRSVRGFSSERRNPFNSQRRASVEGRVEHNVVLLHFE